MRTKKGHGEEPKKRDPLIDMGYETEDINLKGIGKGAVWFFGFTFFSIAAAGAILKLMSPTAFDHSPMEVPMVRQSPPEGTPLLQSNMSVRTDTADLRKAEAEALTTSGWVNKKAGIVHMPIDRALDMYLKKGASLDPVASDVVIGKAPATGMVSPSNPATATADSPNPVHEGGQP